MKLGAYIALKDKLNADYREKFDFVEHYCEIHGISGRIMAEKMMDLMDLMLEAQEKGRSAAQVIGEDTASFCKNYFEDVTASDLLRSAFRHIRFYAWVVFVFEMLSLFACMGEGDFHFFTYRTDVSGYMIGLAVGCAGIGLADVVGWIMAKRNHYSRKIWTAIAIVGTVAAIILAGVLWEYSGLFSLPGHSLIIVSGVYLLAYYGISLGRRYRKTGSLRPPENLYETTFTGLVKAEILNTDYSEDVSVVRTFAKRYMRKNARRVKRGRERLTTEAFFCWENRVNRYALPVGFLVGLVLCALIFPPEDGVMFESFFDFGFFAVLMALIYFVLARFMRKVGKVTALEQQSILKACTERGVELDEYWAMLRSRQKQK